MYITQSSTGQIGIAQGIQLSLFLLHKHSLRTLKCQALCFLNSNTKNKI